MFSNIESDKKKYALAVDVVIVGITILLCSILIYQYQSIVVHTQDLREEQYVRKVNPQNDLIFGNPQAEIFIVEYGDLECPYCREFHPHAKRFIQGPWGVSGKVAWVWRHGFHINNTSVEKAKVVECIRKYGGSQSNVKVWDFLNESLLGGVYEINYPFDRYQTIYSLLDLPADRIEQCRRNNEVFGQIKKAYVDIEEIGISETPYIQLISDTGELLFENFGVLTTSQIEEFVNIFFNSRR